MAETMAARIHDGRLAQDELEQALDAAGAVFNRLRYDDYDNSVELDGVPADHRLPDAAQRELHGAGFYIAFVNHVNGWETIYSFDPKAEFAPTDGWRKSQPEKRADGDPAILVESFPDSWPREWLETGYVRVVEPVCRARKEA